MPYPTEHAARIESPRRYIKFRRKNDELGTGIDVMYGITDKGKAELQAIRFKVDEFTVREAKQWLKEHNYEPLKFEPAGKRIGALKRVLRVRKDNPMTQWQVGDKVQTRLSLSSEYDTAFGAIVAVHTQRGKQCFDVEFLDKSIETFTAIGMLRFRKTKQNPAKTKVSKPFTQQVFFRSTDSYGYFVIQIGDKVYEGEVSPYLLSKLKFMLSKGALGKVVNLLKKYIGREITEQYFETEKSHVRSNPARNAELIYDEVLSIEAIKGDDSLFPNQHFRHDFDSHPQMYGLPDGSILITHDDKATLKKNPLWANVSGYKKGIDY